VSLYKPPGTSRWWCRFRIRGREVRESTKTEVRADAEEYEERARRRVWREVELGQRAYVFGEAVKAYQEDRTALAAKTRYRNDYILAWFGNPKTGPLHGLPLLSITPAVIQAARQALQRLFSPATANRYLCVLSAVLNHAVTRGMLKVAPKVPLFPLREKDPVFITREQFAALLHELPAHLKAPVLFSVLTGLRMANVRDLVWGRVDIWRAHCWIPRDSAKGKRPISVPLPDEAVELLKAQPWIPDVEHIFTYCGRPIRGSFNTKAYRAALGRAGLGDAGVKWHTLRHTWASWMAQEGASTLILKELGGWQSARMAERYAHLSQNELRAWAARMKTGKG
jgi:integrase